MWGEHNVHSIIMHSPVICILLYVPVILLILHMLYNLVKIFITILENASTYLTSTAHKNVLYSEEFVTFLCIANGSRLVWTLNSRSEFSFDDLGKVEKIIHKPLSDSYATLLPRGDGMWISTYSLLSLPSSGNMTVACFDGSDSEELTISVMAGMYSSNYYYCEL